MISALLDRKISIESKVITRSGYGSPIESWSEETTAWCRVNPIRGGESFDLGKIRTVGISFTTYWQDGLDTSMRVLYEGSYWDIIEIRQIGYREGMIIIAELVE